MKHRNLIPAVFAAIALAVIPTACSQEGQMAKSFQATEENVKLIGRTYYNDNELLCAFSGTGIEFTFNGTKAEITISGDSAAVPSNTDNNARVAIYANGVRVVDDMLDEAEKTYTAFESDTAQDVTIRVIKLSETAMSTFSIKEIRLDTTNGIVPTEKKERFIEFIGDSITCGYGVDDEVKEHHFSTSTEDVTKAYAYKTAELFGADYSMVSISGYGIISGYTDDAKLSEQTLPQHYEKIGFSYARNLNDCAWDFSSRQPDLIVINLGTNDDSYCQDDAEKQAEYTVKYAEFIKTVRKNNPEAPILCVLGVMGDRLYPCIEQAVAAYSAETGDTNITTGRLPMQSETDGYAADWHPTETTHNKEAKSIARLITQFVGWKTAE